MPNDVKLQEGHPVDENLRPLKVGGKSTAIETAQHGNGARVNGDLIVTGEIKGKTDIQLTDDITCDDITCDDIACDEMVVDKNYSDTTAATIKALHVDLDRTGDVTTGADYSAGIDLDVTHTGASGGAIYSHGIDIDVVGDSVSGVSKGYGVDINVSGFDLCYGIVINNKDGGIDFRNYSSESSLDYFTLKTIEDGETTLETYESGGGSTAHLNMVADGDFTVNAAGDIDIRATVGSINLFANANHYYMGSYIDFDGNGLGGAGASMKLMSILDTGDYFMIDTTTNGVTTISTVDDDAEGADLTLNIDGYVDINSASGENITLDSGGSIILDAANGIFKFYDAFDLNDYCQLTVAGATGATTLSTVSADDDGHLTLDIDGSIILDSNDGNFIAMKAGTEFSAANSAYAGMILGYTRLQSDLTNQGSFEIQNTMTVEDDTHQITFKTPPSELVEIEATFMINTISTDTRISIALSDQSASEGYNSLGIEYEYDASGVVHSDDEADDGIYVVKWVVVASDLEAIGSSNTLYIGFSTSGATKSAYLTYGYRATHSIMDQPFIIKATALPATIYDGL